MVKECTTSKRQNDELKAKNIELEKKLGISVDSAGYIFSQIILKIIS
jgi:hypothetical protein